MAFLQELTTNKIKLFQLFLQDRDLVDLLTNTTTEALPAMELQYEQVFPYPWLDDTVTQVKSYLCFDVTVPRVNTAVVKDVYLHVWIFTHQQLMRTATGTRIDRIASTVDYLLNGSTNFGLGKVDLKTLENITPAKGFYGRHLVYEVQDFNRICSKI